MAYCLKYTGTTKIINMTTATYRSTSSHNTFQHIYRERTSRVHESLFEIDTIENSLQNGAFEKSGSKRSDRFDIVWIKAGSGCLTVDAEKYDLNDSVLYCTKPGQVCRQTLDPATNGYHISFSQEFVRLADHYKGSFEWFERNENWGQVTLYQIDAEMQQNIGGVIQQMMHEYTHYRLSRLELLKGLLNMLVLYFYRIDSCNRIPLETHEKKTACLFFQSVKKNFPHQKLVSYYALQLGISPNYLNRVIKQLSGCTASHHIQQQILLEAKRLAIHSGDSMKQIAYHLGFESPSHFSKFFKNKSGVNFTDFKRTCQDAY